MPFYFLDLATVKCAQCGATPDVNLYLDDETAGETLYAAGWRSGGQVSCPACNKKDGDSLPAG